MELGENSTHRRAQASSFPPIRIEGAHAHSLKHISVEIPRGGMTLVSGPSGSGKSSLLIETLGAEGRYRVELAMNHHRESKCPRAKVNSIRGLPPLFTLSARSTVPPRACTAEFLGAAESLLSLVTAHGTISCAQCGGEVRATPPEQFINHQFMVHEGWEILLTLSDGASTAEEILRRGFSHSLTEDGLTNLNNIAGNNVVSEVVIDQFAIEPIARERVREAFSLAAGLSSRPLLARTRKSSEISWEKCTPEFLSSLPVCVRCGATSPRLSPGSFRDIDAHSPLCRAEIDAQPLISLVSAEISQIVASLERLPSAPARDSLVTQVSTCVELGLGHLTLSRHLRTLSSGEFQRLRLAKTVTSSYQQGVLVLDEPTSGLHAHDRARAMRVIQRALDSGATIIASDTDPQIREIASHEIALGPGSGRRGGSIVYHGKVRKVSTTPPDLRRASPPPSSGALNVSNLSLHSLKSISLSLPLERLVVVTGVSGSGKSSLVFHGIAHELSKENSETVTLTSAKGKLRVAPLARLREDLIRSSLTVGGFSQFFAALGDFYSSLPHSRARGYSSSDFKSLITASPEERSPLRDIRFRGYSFEDFLDCSVDESIEIVSKLPPCRRPLEALVRFNLGYLMLGQSLQTLSTGERQRTRLARVLSESSRPSLFLFDEPCRGLDADSVRHFTSALLRLTEEGHSIIAIEHNPTVINSADIVVEMGPGAGVYGGRIVSIQTRGGSEP